MSGPHPFSALRAPWGAARRVRNQVETVRLVAGMSALTVWPATPQATRPELLDMSPDERSTMKKQRPDE